MLTSFVNAMKVCENAKGAGSDDIKKSAIAKLDADGQRLMVEMLSPFRVFGVKKFAMPKTFNDADEPAEIFFVLLDRLHKRELTGNAAKNAITETMGLYTAETAKYLARVLDKDPKAGFSESTVNKVFPKLVPTWTAMKGVKVDKKYEFEFPMRADYKYDGERCIALSGNPVLYFSFAGKPQEHLNGLFDEQINAIAAKIGKPIVLDGEYLGANFSETTRSKKDSPEGHALRQKLKFIAFDIMTQDEWHNESCPFHQEHRTAMVDEMVKFVNNPNKLVMAQGKVVHNMPELQAYYEEACEEVEGLMLKKLHGIYEWKRSKYWAKWKPVQDYDLKIVGFEEGKAGTKNEGSLGALVLEGKDENGNKIRTNCGGIKVRHPKMQAWLEEIGIDAKVIKNVDELIRAHIWRNQERYLGRTLMIEGQEATLADGADVYSIRFPQAIGLRDDKEAEV